MALTDKQRKEIAWAAEMVKMRQESEARGTTAQDFKDMAKRNASPKPAPKGRLEKVKEWMEAHPHNRREPERKERRAPAAPRGRTVSRVDKYQDGKVTETIYFGTDEKTPRRQAPRKQPKPRGDPLGGLGSGMTMQDFIPSNMGLGSAMGYTEPRGKKRKKQDNAWMDPSYIPPHLRQFF